MACDFFVVITPTFRTLYVFVLSIEFRWLHLRTLSAVYSLLRLFKRNRSSSMVCACFNSSKTRRSSSQVRFLEAAAAARTISAA
jgi:hypothetical protein